jgi:hypothetical protein
MRRPDLRIRLGTMLLLVAVAGIVSAAVAVVYSEKHENEVYWKHIQFVEERNAHAAGVAAAVFRSIAEDNYAALRPLLVEVAQAPPLAPDAPGRELAVRDKVRRWLHEHKREGTRFTDYVILEWVSDPSDPLGTRCSWKGNLTFSGDDRIGLHVTLVRTPLYASHGVNWKRDAEVWRVAALELSEWPRRTPELEKYLKSSSPPPPRVTVYP